MYTNNLILDLNNTIKISQNLNTYFVISKSLNMKDSIEIKIQPYEDIDMLNLYLMIKSYIMNVIYVSSNFFIIVKNKNEKEFIACNVSTNELKNLSYYGFINWFYDELHNDWKYIKDDGEYFFIITYPMDIFDKDLITFLRPRYPWDSKILSFLTKLKSNEEYYIITIENQKKEIENLKKEIENQKKEIENQKK